MNSLKGKKVLLGISGGIAAYKIPLLVRLLKKNGAQVKIILTKEATQFVTCKTLSVLSENEVLSEFFNESGIWNNHVHLGMWADVLLIAPATANTIAKMASGICDNLLLATYLSARCKTIVAPAMDLDMYAHPSTKENIQLLEKRENQIIPAELGELASGLTGEGRMPEPESLFNYLADFFKTQKGDFYGKKVLITAGPTFEAIDPVRFIGNRSSGKMGICIAEELARKGAEVTLILGPSHLSPEQENINLIRVESAQEMYESCIKEFETSHIAILSAAVADYKPLAAEKEKIKKKDDNLELKLQKTKDILSELGQQKKSQILVGFALETENLIENAKEKLRKKNLDFIVANQPGKMTGFSSDTNEVTLIDKHNNLHKFELDSKEKIASQIIAFLHSRLNT